MFVFKFDATNYPIVLIIKVFVFEFDVTKTVVLSNV